MTYTVHLFAHPHLTPEEILKAEDAAKKALSRYPEKILLAMYVDNMEMLEAGLKHAERGKSAWSSVEWEAEKAARDALQCDKWHNPWPEGMHLRFFFH